jgi:hypothetical protein
MKKLFILFVAILLLFINLQNSALAFGKTQQPIITNNLQREQEAKLKAESGNGVDLGLFNGMYLFKNDYEVYQKGGKSLYGLIVNFKSDANAKYIDTKYIDMYKNNFHAYLNNKTDPTISYYITIDDKDWNNISKELKDYVLMFNFLIDANKDEYVDFAIQSVNKEIEKQNTDFQNHKNNMKLNKEQVENLDVTINSYNSYIEWCKKIQSNYGYNYRVLQNKNLHKQEVENFKAQYQNLRNTISSYSYSYEKTKYTNWVARNHKKLSGGDLASIVYSPVYNPQYGYIYFYNSNWYPLQVVQSVPNGIIVTGVYGYGSTSLKNIFIQTSKQYADGQIIKEPITAEYRGLYDYISVLGVRKRIFKFYQYSQKEIDNNFKIPGETFYFYHY